MSTFQQLQENPRNAQAFDTWYRKTYPELYMAAFRITRGDRLLAEDLCHDAILAFFTRGGITSVSDENGGLRYLRKTLTNAYISRLRRARTEMTAETLAAADAEDSVLDKLLAHDEYINFVEGLGADRQALLGMMLAGMPLSEIAQTLGISYSNAAGRVYKIRRVINEMLDRA
jgi:RNA polymerase sigma factor (sigma-70 family)